MRRLLIVFALLIALAILAAAATVFLARGRPLSDRPQILVWMLDGALVDQRESSAIGLLRRRTPQDLAAVHRLLSMARLDERVVGLAVYIQNARFGFGKAQEVRDLLLSLAASGKFVDCYLETAGEGSNGTLAYHVASACERISLSPLGEVNAVGLYSDSPFIRGALDKLSIEPQFLHVGEYKSAGEFYTETQHSEESRAVLNGVLDDLFDQIVQAIADSRALDPETVRSIIDRAPLSADEALHEGLIDEITYPDLFEERLREKAGGDPRLVPLGDYVATSRPGRRVRVAVVFAQGTIIRGSNGTDPWSRQRYFGADTAREILRSLKNEDEVVGVVLRVDSPGGSPVASDLILREVELLAAAKPVVVSMSDVAASGGYYISSKATKIVAEPATITGSIGVVGGKLATRRFQQDLLGISHDTLGRGANADFYSSLDPFSPEQQQQFYELMERIYRRFVGHVADGRKLSIEQVEEVAGGRIWTGRQATTAGLVDEIGGLDRAVALVLEATGRDPSTPVALDFRPRPPGLIEFLTELFGPFIGASRGRWPPFPEPEMPRGLELPREVLQLLQG